MSNDLRLIPTSSQTVGPYFRIGLDCMMERIPASSLEVPGMIAIRGQVLDRDGVAVPDAMLEFWSASTKHGAFDTELATAGCPTGFRRVATGVDGGFSVVIERPFPSEEQGDQGLHFDVLVFARGLLRQLLTRVYLGDGEINQTDPLLVTIPEERRATLIAKADHPRANVFHWTIRLQGTGETVFFAW